MTKRRAILHIGVMKTGSKSIQDWLAAQRVALAAVGIHAPTSLGKNQSILGMLAYTYGEAKPKEETHRLAKLRTELEGLPDTLHTVVFSGETMSRAMRTDQHVRRLKSVLDPYFDRYRIIIYLRRQDEQTVSQYSSDLRRGIVEFGPLGRPPIDYELLLNLWSEVFGRAAVVPRVFERASMANGDVVADFAATAELGVPVGEGKAAPQNAALRPNAQELLVRLAGFGKASGLDGGEFANLAARKTLVRTLDAHFGGVGVQPARTAAMAYLAGCRDANERVRREWFPQRAALFSDSFDRYPEASTPAATADEVLEAALTAIFGLMADTPSKPGQDKHKPWIQEQQDRKARKTERRQRRERRAGEGPGSRTVVDCLEKQTDL